MYSQQHRKQKKQQQNFHVFPNDDQNFEKVCNKVFIFSPPKKCWFGSVHNWVNVGIWPLPPSDGSEMNRKSWQTLTKCFRPVPPRNILWKILTNSNSRAPQAKIYPIREVHLICVVYVAKFARYQRKRDYICFGLISN